jgi:hypothetical protein
MTLAKINNLTTIILVVETSWKEYASSRINFNKDAFYKSLNDCNFLDMNLYNWQEITLNKFSVKEVIYERTQWLEIIDYKDFPEEEKDIYHKYRDRIYKNYFIINLPKIEKRIYIF